MGIRAVARGRTETEGRGTVAENTSGSPDKAISAVSLEERQGVAGMGQGKGYMEAWKMLCLQEARQCEGEQEEDLARLQENVEHKANLNGQVSSQCEEEIRRLALDPCLRSSIQGYSA